MKTVDLKCSYCGITFKKPQNEYNRSIRCKRNLFYCCRAHGGLAQVYKLKPPISDAKHLNPGNKRDRYTGLRDFRKRIKSRTKEDVSLEDLKLQWDTQNGKCMYTGVELQLPIGNTRLPGCPSYKLASVDRIDSSKGYIIGNIQFISLTANYAKNTMTHEEMLCFIKLIKNTPL